MLMNMENKTCRDEQKNAKQSNGYTVVCSLLYTTHVTIVLHCCLDIYEERNFSFMSLSYMYIKEFL